jgi:pyruvate/2-oxoglutarate dehydrogenase complex dihydrolipoamide acyltransferase (E2) component
VGQPTPITVPNSPEPLTTEWDQDEVLVVAIDVAVGDRVEVDQFLLEVETNKITLDIVSPVRGTVSDISVSLNDVVALGGALMTIDAD